MRILRDAEATQSRLRAALPGGQILYVASHARQLPRAVAFVFRAGARRRTARRRAVVHVGSSRRCRSRACGWPCSRRAARGWSGGAGRRVAESGEAVPVGRRAERDREPAARQRSPRRGRCSRISIRTLYRALPPRWRCATRSSPCWNPDAGLQSPTFWAPFVAIGGTSTGKNANGAAVGSCPRDPRCHQRLNEVRDERVR